VFAAERPDRRQVAAITARCVTGGRAEVLDESRTVPVADGAIRDVFADGNAVHAYRFRADPACGLDEAVPQAP
jgi:hypothetical protein